MTAFADSTLRTACASSLGLALLAGGPALAQQSGQSRLDSTIIEEIIVTAQKRTENLQDVPLAISVVGAQQLEDYHVNQLTDIAAYVPGLQVTNGGTPGQTTVSLRGIAPISPGATVATYIDETPVGSSGFFQRATAFMLDLLPYDIGRVEVLRGPQGTLYGAGAMGGLLKYVTRDPDVTKGEFRVGVGVSDVQGAGDLGREARIGANLPLVADRLALRASYARNELPGYIDNSVTGRKDINDGTQESARVALLWQAGDAFSLQLTAMRQSIDSDNNAIAALTVAQRPLSRDLQNVLFVDEPFEKDIDFYSATLKWDLGWADFIAASGYSDVTTDQRADATAAVGELPPLFGLPPGIAFFQLGLDLQKFTQEVRLTSKTEGRFEWQVGAFYTDESADNSQVVPIRPATGGSYPPLPSPPFPSPSLSPLAVVALPSDYEEIALFGNASYEFTDRFSLGAGVRLARNKQDFAQVVTAGILIPIGTTPGGSDEDVFTWSFGPKFQLAEDTMLYMRVATGYQPGGPNIALPGVPPTVDAATLTSYELGLKSDLAESRVSIDLAAFYIDWKDIQVSASINGLSFLTNGGKAVSQGVEVSTSFRPADRLRLGLNAAYTDAELSDDLPLLPLPGGGFFRSGFKGDPLPFIPEFSWSATADYVFPLGSTWNVQFGGGFRWVDQRESGLTNTNPFVFSAPALDSYHALDLNAALSNDNWTIRAFGKNVTDERAYLTIGAAQSLLPPFATSHLIAAALQPRTWGISVDYRF